MKHLLLVLLLAGCASPQAERPAVPESGPQPDESELLEALRGRMGQLDDQLRDSLETPQPRCERQCALAGQICELSEKICSLAQRHADDADHDFAETCRDGRARCARARQHVAACPCPATER